MHKHEICTRFIMNKPNGYIMTTYSYHNTTVVFESYHFQPKNFFFITKEEGSFVCIEAFNSSKT